jgi:rhodanese-related sulfurtransferase
MKQWKVQQQAPLGEGAQGMTPPDVDHVDPIEGKRRVDAGALLLDVRNPDEWQAGHGEGAAWIPMGELAERQEELPTDREIVVVCKVGARSARVAQALVGAGYGAVNVAGGYEAWQAAGLAIVNDDGQPGTVA